jgi:hypothetical protein
MKNIDENSISRYKNREMICSICKKDKLPIDSMKIKEKKIKEIISKFDKKNLDSSILIKKCNCHNNTEKVHKFCLLLNIIFSFELKCNECKANYNIDISKKKNKHKNICNLISFMLLLLFHLILYAGSIFLLLFIFFINKNIKNNFEENKLYHIYYFFGGVLFIMNTVLIIITFSNFLDKNNKDIYDYFIDIKDINEQNKIDKNSEYFYSLLYKYYRCFYNSQIRYLIGKKQEHMYISKGYGYFNKDLKEYIKKNNEEIKLKKTGKNKEEIMINNGAEDILSINLKKDKKISNEIQKNNNIVNSKSNPVEENNEINIYKNENNKKEVKQKNEEEEKKSIRDKDKEKDIYEKKKNYNDDNYKLNEKKENKINDEFVEKIDSPKDSKNEAKVDVNLNYEKDMNENKENEGENKKMSVITFNKLSVISNKILDQISKTSLFKKVIKKNNGIIGKSNTLIKNCNKRKRRKSKKEKKEFKKIEEVSEKKYIDSTLLIRAEKMDSKVENNNENKIEKKPSDFKGSCSNNEK